MKPRSVDGMGETEWAEITLFEVQVSEIWLLPGASYFQKESPCIKRVSKCIS